MTSPKQHAINLYMHGIRDGQPQKALDENTGAVYWQHSTGVADGKEGFLAFFEPFLERNPEREIEVVRALQDGSRVFVHVSQHLNGRQSSWVTTDFFESDGDGKIIEHWDVIAELKGTNPSGRTQIDGATDITDLDKTDENRALVAEFINRCLIRRDVNAMSSYINPDKYIQHNGEVGDGLAPFLSHFGVENCPLTYQELYLIVAEGNFVATLNRARWQDQDLCQCDIFRIEDGMIVEHWDNSEPVPPRADWANSGKF